MLLDTCVVSSTKSNIRELFQVSNSLDSNEEKIKCTIAILDHFIPHLKEKSIKNVFKFFGKKSKGLSMNEFKVPEKGYGFFGWIRVDKTDLVQDNACLWQFIATNKFTFKLSLIKGKVVYTLGDKHEINLSEDIVPNKWHFIELYHTNNIVFAFINC